MTDAAIVCLGEALIDQVVYPSGERQDFPGGAPANVATALAQFSVPTAFLGCLGTDAYGRSLLEVLQQKGVGLQGIQYSEKPTRVVEVRCTEGGDRTFGGFVGGETTDFADTRLTTQALPVPLLQAADALIVGTLGLAYPKTRAAMERAATLMQAGGGQVIIDLNWRPTFWPSPEQALAMVGPWLQRADWLKLSTEDATALFGSTDIAWLVRQFPSAQAILLTDGARGCTYGVLGKTGLAYTGALPAFAVACQDTTGAGDAFLAGMLYHLNRRQWQVPPPDEMAQVLTFASAMGALTTLRPGAIAAQPTLDEVTAFLQARTGKVWAI